MAAESQRKRIEDRIQDTFGDQPEHLWERYPDHTVFRHPASRKWYALIMLLPPDRLGLEREENIDVLDLKCSHILLGSLLEEAGFFPAYHMNRNSWISILLDGTVPDERIFQLLELSRDSAAPSRARRREK